MLDAWLDLIAGGACVGCRRPGRLLCATCAATLPTQPRSTRPTPCPPGLAECWVGAPYADTARAMVLAHKERRAFALARPLGELLAVAVRGVVERPSLDGARVVLVPVPSRPAVVRARGHDPMLRVTRQAARLLRGEGLAVRPARLLRQAVRPEDQAGLDAAQRRANLDRSMAGRVPELARLARSRAEVVAVVCDDVLTTGATAREAQRALSAVGVPVAGVACVSGTVLRAGVTHMGEVAAEVAARTVDRSPRTN